ncbi:Predicted gene 11032 [Apodemus speciosus]|uniref:Predicted gene 11032 n=1 Tax=Apodemus speciosus TaxID=105296 RepID=A0ABQ0FER6_APOSI
MVSLYSLGCPGTHSIDQAGLELRNLPASASQVLGLKVTCAFLDTQKPLIPKGCDSWLCQSKAASRLPTATPPPLATAAADIISAAMDPAAMPVPVKPTTPRMMGGAATAMAVGRGARRRISDPIAGAKPVMHSNPEQPLSPVGET